MKSPFRDGRAIRELWLPGDGNADNTSYFASGAQSISLRITESGEMWANVAREGAEISINLRQVTTVVWEDAP